jgi:hypothetical protein
LASVTPRLVAAEANNTERPSSQIGPPALVPSGGRTVCPPLVNSRQLNASASASACGAGAKNSDDERTAASTATEPRLRIENS